VEQQARPKPSRLRRGAVAALLAVVAAAGLMAAPADALQKFTWSKGVTSDSTAFRSVVTCYHPSGTMGVRQTYGTNGAAGSSRLQNVNYRTYTTVKSTSSGGLIQWTNVASGSHTLQVRRLHPADSNGYWVAGSGVTTFQGRYSCP
jgi:hypothetical protein